MMRSIKDCTNFLGTTNWNRAAAASFVILLGVGFGIGFSVASDEARNKSARETKALSNEFIDWQMTITAQFTKAESLATTFAAFMASHATTPTNYSASPAERWEVISNETFVSFVQDMIDIIPGIMSIQLHPHAIISQQWPEGFTESGYDMMNHVSRGISYRDVIAHGKPITAGPYTFTQGGTGVVIRYPVYTGNPKTSATFFGMANVLMRFTEIFKALGLDEAVRAINYDFVCYYEKAGVRTVIVSSPGAHEAEVIDKGMQMVLPVSEPGTTTYLSMYPRDGIASDSASPAIMGAIVAAVVIASALLVGLLYVGLFAAFLWRHRHAPKTAGGVPVFFCLVSLRGAQSIVDGSPQEAVRMFTEFGKAVAATAARNSAYCVSEVGDRSLLVVAAHAEDVMNLAEDMATHYSIAPNLTPVLPTNGSPSGGRKKSQHASATNNANAAADLRRIDLRSVTHSRRSSISSASQVTSRQLSRIDDGNAVPSASSNALVSCLPCHPSVACHAAKTVRVYDPIRDVYFYGSPSLLSRVGTVADAAVAGEVAWTTAFHDGSTTKYSYSNTIIEKERVSIYVSTLWQCEEEGGDRSSEDPSAAVAVMTDPYVRRMATLVGEERSENGSGGSGNRRNGGKKGGGGAKASSASSDNSNNATLLTRSATILHIAVTGEAKTAIDLCKRIVAEERGAVVSAHDTTIVAAFNLLSAGGHHQLRAADTVHRLRSLLPTTRFVCSIHHGKVSALISDGLVMCTGEVVNIGRLLLDRAIETAKIGNALAPLTRLTSGLVPAKDPTASPGRLLGSFNGALESSNGLCLMLCAAELTSAYDCEAIDIVLAPNPRIMSRLAGPKSGAADKMADDEWMYQLKEKEDHGVYTRVNAVFAKIASNDLVEASAMWSRCAEDSSFVCSELAKEGVARFLYQ